MSKRKKASILFVILLVIPLALFAFIHYQHIEPLPFTLVEMTEWPFVGPYMPLFLFWLSSFVIVVSLVSLLVIIVSPKKRKSLTLQKEQGTLMITDRAITNFVHAIAMEQSWISNATVTTKIKKKSIRLTMRGQLSGAPYTPLQAERFTKRVETELAQLLGITDQKEIIVELDDFQPQKEKATRHHQTNQPRVI